MAAEFIARVASSLSSVEPAAWDACANAGRDPAERYNPFVSHAFLSALERSGSVDKFKEEFQAQGLGQFGSGWVWLEIKDGKLAVRKTANAENPLVFGAKPLLVADVWEHSYYIDYRNRRPDYLKAWVDNLVNWEYVAELLGQK